MNKSNSIRQRIAWGYAIPLVIAVAGIATGLGLGKQTTNQALKTQEAAIAERKLLDTIRVKLLSYRPSREFSRKLNNAEAIQVEGEQLYALLAEIQNLAALHAGIRSDLDQDILGGLTVTEHQALRDTFVQLQESLVTFELRVQAFILEASDLTEQPNRQVLAQQTLLRFVQGAEYNQLLDAAYQLGYFVEQLDVQEKMAQDALDRAFWLQTLVILSSLLLSVLSAGLIAWRNSRAISRPIVEVTDIASRVTEEGDFSLRATVYSQDEVGILAHALNRLIEQVKQLLDEVNHKNVELSAALTQLETQQVQLIQSEKMSSLGQLVAGVAHEINNPVNFIHGNLEHVKQHVDDVLFIVRELQAQHPDAVADIEAINEDIELDFIQQDLGKILTSMRVGTERIREIVLSLRNFSRLDEADFKTVNLHEGLDSSLMILQHRFKASTERPEIEVICHYGDLPPVECYPGKLNQVILNLLTNAIDAIEERYFKTDRRLEMPLAVKITTQIWQENWVEIAISDTGTGMSDEVKQRLFDKFFTTKAVGVGTGIGMSISHQIITDFHHGQLTLESTQNVGTTFFIRIPSQQDLSSTLPERDDPKAVVGIG
ncbi:MAG: HAMP domain-containing histidine kinase [Leptolyngbya sp. SIOISBB]|nr:HAMP domain-containing histidine kinase [Leptolyngbya sp. SIOISBB]